MQITISQSLFALIQSIAPKCRCARLLLRATGRGADGWPTTRTSRMASRYLSPDAPGDFIAYREASGMLSYCPAGRTQEISDDGNWKRRGRQDCKPARLIAKLLHPRLVKHLKPEMLNNFATLFKTAEDSAALAVEAVDFEYAYNQANYREDTFGSCMWGCPVGDFYRRAGAEMRVVRDGTGKLRGRAVFWPQVHRVKPGETVAVLDRIYADGPEVTEFLCQWAATNGVYRKTYQGMHNKTEFTAPDGESIYAGGAYVSTKQSVSDAIYYPYLDTFTWGDADGDLRNLEETENGYAYDCTGGSRTRIQEDDHDGEVQDIDGEWISEDSATLVGEDYYPDGDERITFCERSQEHVLTCECYRVEISRHTTIYIHRDFVEEL